MVDNFSFNFIGKQYCDAMRTEPVFSDGSKAFWKLKSYNGEYAVLLQGNSQNELA